MTNSELLSLTAVRLECTLIDNSISSGSGFFFAFERTQNFADKIVIITNKHVIEDSFNLKLRFIPDNNGDPDYGSNFSITFSIKESDWIGHPNIGVDLAMLPVDNILDKIRKKYGDISFYVYSKDDIPTIFQIQKLRVIEDVYMIGYPLGLIDDLNSVPFFRRGITASHPKFNFNGDREFIIDSSILPGSSGSAVVIFNEGGFVDRNGNLNMDGRLFLLGILYAEPHYEVTGELRKRKIPRNKKDIVVFDDIPTNLGMVIKSSRILEMEKLFK